MVFELSIEYAELANLTRATLSEKDILSFVHSLMSFCSFVARIGLAMDQHQDYMNNAPNSYSYNSGDTMSASLGGMTISDLHHQENGVQLGHRNPGDGPMKGQTPISHREAAELE